jgi:hypothetical protein
MTKVSESAERIRPVVFVKIAVIRIPKHRHIDFVL